LFNRFLSKINSFGLVYKIIKDLNRTAFIGAIIYENGLFSYIILSEGIKLGHKIYSGSQKYFKGRLNKGYAMPLHTINLFTIVNILKLDLILEPLYREQLGQVH
jgi:ribosomal protein L2